VFVGLHEPGREMEPETKTTSTGSKPFGGKADAATAQKNVSIAGYDSKSRNALRAHEVVNLSALRERVTAILARHFGVPARPMRYGDTSTEGLRGRRRAKGGIRKVPMLNPKTS
jgi:hypothetical protein